MQRRVLYLYLPNWPIDRLRHTNKGRTGAPPSPNGTAAAPADDAASPFATVMSSAGRRLLAAVNPAAATAGLASGMPLADALSFVPGLATRPAEPAADAAALDRLAEWCGRYSPWTAPDFRSGEGADGVKIEITGCAHLWGGEEALAADLACRLSRQDIDHRIAIAGSLGAAWALARFAAEPGRPALPQPEEEEAALAPLPVEALRLEPLTAAGLRRVGLRRVGDLLPMPRDALARRFGEVVLRRLDQARGTEPEPLSPLGETPARRVRLSFAEPIADPADLALAIGRLVADLTARLAQEGAGARRLGLAFHRVDGRVEHIRLGTARPTRDPKHLAKLFVAQIETIDPGFGIEDMILALYAADPLPPEQTRFARGPGPGAENGVAPLIDRLGARLGLDAISRLEARESHIPERASVCVPLAGTAAVPAASGGRGARGPDAAKPPRNSSRIPGERRSPLFGRNGSGGDSDKKASSAAALEKTGRPPRPVRLFAPPEPVDAVVWVVPDDPPQRFTWRRRAYRVRRADGPERIAEEWWTQDGSAVAAMTDALRDYYRVEDEEGRRFWLFRAGLPGADPPASPSSRWFMHGIFA